MIRSFSPRYLVISAGMDIYEKDLLGRFKVTTGGIRSIGERIAALGLPTAVIMEGGYDNADLGRNVAAFLSPFES
jgi:acetoin utilization deacetylase AcuC-like enzyme